MLLWLAVALAQEAPERLTLERLYDDPAISGPTPRAVKLSPDGAMATFLRGKEDDYQQQDLWALDIETGEARLLVDSRVLEPEPVALSEEEKARRERQRQSATGIVAYSWSEDGQALLFPLGGDVWHYDLGSGASRQLTDTEAFETDVRTSPEGTYVSFLRDQDLFVVDVESGAEQALTTDGEGLVHNGDTEFVAQEELDRHHGYWWSPDEQHLAFARVDDSPVGLEQRVEINADTIDVREQRYPRAGTANAAVTLGVVPVGGGEATWLELGEDEVYLARVTWADADSLLVQLLDRDQQRLRLFRYALDGTRTLLLEETSESWVDLHHDLRVLDDGTFVWASERTGFKHLSLHRLRDGKRLRQLTDGDWVVGHVTAVDQEKGWLYFTGFADSTVEQHLYRVKLKGRGKPVRLTEPGGWHGVSMDKAASAILDTFSAPSTPPQTRLLSADGTFRAWIEENTLEEGHPYWPYVGSHTEPSFGQLPGADGTMLDYSVLYPPDFDPSKPWPVVLTPYGGPHGHRVKRSWDVGWERILANNGYVVLTVDGRGADHRGQAFEAALHLQMGFPEVDDQAAAAAWVRTQGWADPERVGVFGWSYGGYLTLMALSRHPDAFDAGVAVAPVTEWSLYDTAYTERYMGTPEGNAEGYARADVLTHLDGLDDPLLIVHGMADDNVLFLHSTRLFAALQERGIVYDELTYPGKKHGIRGKATRIHLYRSVLAFLERNL